MIVKKIFRGVSVTNIFFYIFLHMVHNFKHHLWRTSHNWKWSAPPSWVPSVWSLVKKGHHVSVTGQMWQHVYFFCHVSLLGCDSGWYRASEADLGAGHPGPAHEDPVSSGGAAAEPPSWRSGPPAPGGLPVQWGLSGKLMDDVTILQWCPLTSRLQPSPDFPNENTEDALMFIS